MKSFSVLIIGPRLSVQGVSTSGTVTYGQEPSLQKIDKKSYFPFQYHYSHRKDLARDFITELTVSTNACYPRSPHIWVIT